MKAFTCSGGFCQSTFSQSMLGRGAGPSTMKSAQRFSVWATCLISPPR